MKGMLHLWEICENYLEIASFSDSPSTQKERIWKVRGAITFKVWSLTLAWSRSLCREEPILSLVFQGKSKSDTFNGTLSIKAGRSRGIFFYQNAELIDRLRFMSRSSDITRVILGLQFTSVFASQFIPLTSFFTCSPFTLSLSLHHPPSVLYPMFN